MTFTAFASYEPERAFVDVRELLCADCGYGVVVRRDPPDCPMCHGNSRHDRPTTARWN